ncbi:hypothetical protein MRB53_020487 [Persea americana]|uniref:Uncharacterized protein n=1 Tax=Persea americana TaxID=3435 RepID=A0ACC2L168_PERAE|nr:hypothetical protein MRB53_020487 [Persea americana]
MLDDERRGWRLWSRSWALGATRAGISGSGNGERAGDGAALVSRRDGVVFGDREVGEASVSDSGVRGGCAGLPMEMEWVCDDGNGFPAMDGCLRKDGEVEWLSVIVMDWGLGFVNGRGIWAAGAVRGEDGTGMDR